MKLLRKTGDLLLIGLFISISLHCDQTILLASPLFIYADKHFRLHLFPMNCLFELFCITGCDYYLCYIRTSLGVTEFFINSRRVN